jgi:hypothetical protein
MNIGTERESFRYKISGFCKQEKERTGRCGECLKFDQLVKKVEDGKKLQR